MVGDGDVVSTGVGGRGGRAALLWSAAVGGAVDVGEGTCHGICNVVGETSIGGGRSCGDRADASVGNADVGGGGRRVALLRSAAVGGTAGLGEGTCDGIRNVVGETLIPDAGLSHLIPDRPAPMWAPRVHATHATHAAHAAKTPRSSPSRCPLVGRSSTAREKDAGRHGARRRVVAAARRSDWDRRPPCRAIKFTSHHVTTTVALLIYCTVQIKIQIIIYS